MVIYEESPTAGGARKEQSCVRGEETPSAAPHVLCWGQSLAQGQGKPWKHLGKNIPGEGTGAAWSNEGVPVIIGMK